jgi:hypothetical protein
VDGDRATLLLVPYLSMEGSSEGIAMSLSSTVSPFVLVATM